MNSAHTGSTRVRRSNLKSMEKTQKLFTIKQVTSSARKEIKRRRRESEKKIHIPNDIVEEIMMRLPVNSLMRFQAVSKQWRSLIRSNDFGERHMAFGKSNECKFLLACNANEYFRKAPDFLKTIALETTSASVVDKTALELERGNHLIRISQSCDGLVCFYGINRAVEVINPATKMFIKLPLSRIQQINMHKPGDPNTEYEPVQDPNPVRYPGLSFSQFGFGKDSFTGRYKIVWLYNTYPFTTTTCEVLDLEEKTWRFVDTTALDHHNILNHGYDRGQGPAFANGSVYWLTGDEDGDPLSKTNKLIVFDIHTEMFQVIPTPPFITRDAAGKSIGLCNLNGRLCISEWKGDFQEFWWRVKDNTWEKIFSVHLPSTCTFFYVKLPDCGTPLAICRDTRKVILSGCDIDNDYLVAVDLDSDSTGYHLYFSCSCGLAVPYFPSLSLFHSIDKDSSYVD